MCRQEFAMTSNVGTIDRVLRITVGIAAIAFALFATQIPALKPYAAYAAFGWIGLVPLLTALIGWCPAYSLIGVRTCARQG
jgi:hypothetical protein